jgi:putative glutamine amidotransferase
MRPYIGVVCAVVDGGWYGPTTGNYISYPRAVEAAGGIPQLIHLTGDAEVLRALYERVDGLLLPGGDDIDPARYGETPHPLLGQTSRLHDEVDLTLFAWARADKKPVLGICRGLQLVNVALGGTLYQDITAQKAGALPHREGDIRRDWHYLAHSITLDEHSWLAQTLDVGSIPVNSLHHQGIKSQAPGLRATAHAPDGLVEAVETDDKLVVAVQCHPEELWEKADRRWLRLFEGFVARCRT